ncbi:MAG: hypothetical protein AB7K71_33550 [Polyangiaceae bacterium]
MEPPISLTTYGILLGHLRYFPEDRHDEVLRCLDFEPGEWPGYAERGERTLLSKMEAGEDTTEFTRALGETKRQLKKRSPAVEELPLDQPSAGGEDGPPRTMRLRDLDPVEFLNVISSRMGTNGGEVPPVPEPAFGGFELKPAPRPDVPPMPPVPPRPAPAPPGAVPGVPPMPPAAVSPPALVRPAAPALSPAEAARARTRAAKAAFESTKVSPTSDRMASDRAPRIDVTVQQSASSPFAAPPPESPPPPPTPEHEVSPATQMIRPEEAAFPGVQPPTLSIFEFATLCAEFNACGDANKEKVRLKYGIPTEIERLALLDVWRTRLVQNPNELAEWKQQFDVATRHWQQIYKR